MVAVRRTLTVNCRRCGRSAERVRRADDQRSPAQLQQSARCGFCHARAASGDLDLILRTYSAVSRPGYARPQWPVAPDDEIRLPVALDLAAGDWAALHGNEAPTAAAADDPGPARAGLWRGLVEEVQDVGDGLKRFGQGLAGETADTIKAIGGVLANVAAVIVFAPLAIVALLTGSLIAGGWTAWQLWRHRATLGLVIAVGSVTTAAAALAVGRVGLVGYGIKRSIDYALMPAARQRTVNFDDPLERRDFCHGREYLLAGRGRSEEAHAKQAAVMKYCPEMAARN